MRKFSEYSPTVVTPANTPRVSLSKRFLSLNVKAYEALGKPSGVVLLYDAGTGAIGIRPAEEGEGKACKVQRHAGSSGYRISAIGFYNAFNIDSSPRVFQPLLEESALVFELASGVPTKSRSASKKTPSTPFERKRRAEGR